MVQAIAVAGMGLAAFVSFVLLLKYIGSAWRKYWVPLGGLVVLGVFVLMRAGAHVPWIEEINMKFYNALHVLELLIVLVIGLAALFETGEVHTPAPTAS